MSLALGAVTTPASQPERRQRKPKSKLQFVHTSKVQKRPSNTRQPHPSPTHSSHNGHHRRRKDQLLQHGHRTARTTQPIPLHPEPAREAPKTRSQAFSLHALLDLRPSTRRHRREIEQNARPGTRAVQRHPRGDTGNARMSRHGVLWQRNGALQLNGQTT